MLGELHDLGLGPVSSSVAAVFAVLSCLLGTIVAARARTRTGIRRVRLLVYGTVSVAGTGIWLSGLVNLLGLRVAGSVIRLDPAGLGISLGAAITGTAAAFLVLCYGRGIVRLAAGALLLGAGIAASAYLMLAAIRTGGVLTVVTPLAGVALEIGIATAAVLAFLLSAARSLRGSVAAAVPAGLALAAVHAVAAAGLTVRPGQQGIIPADEVVGLAPMRVGLLAVVIGGVLMAMLWYFGIGTSTGHELRLAFEPEPPGDQIEPWIVEQVQSRVAWSSTALAPAGWGSDVMAEATVAVRSIPLLGSTVATAFAQGVREYRGALAGEVLTSSDDEDAEPPTVDFPGWRPVPGWNGPSAERPVLAPRPVPTPAARAGSRWDQRDWDRDPTARNEQRSAEVRRATNSRHGEVPSRAPVTQQTELVPTGAEVATPVTSDGPAMPLPRRNAR